MLNISFPYFFQRLSYSGLTFIRFIFQDIMRTRHLWFALIFMALGLLKGQAQKIQTWNHPTTEYGNVYFDGFFNIALDITKVELKEDETAVYATIKRRSDYPHLGQFEFSKDTYLLADSKRYPVVSAEGIELGKFRQTEKNGQLDVVFHFRPLPKNTRSFDFIEGDEQGAFQIKGIKPVEERRKELFPSYWRDEQTGEWVIAFLGNQAIYDNKVWDMEAELRHRGKEAEITLTHEGETIKIQVGKNRNGRRTMRMDKQKRTLSMITGRFMPDYPEKDARTDFVDLGNKTDTATIIGWLKDLPETEKGKKQVSVSYTDFITGKRVEHMPQLDSLGRFSIKIPLTSSHEFFFDWDLCYLRTVFEPGKTYFLLYDFKEGRRFFMGDDVRLQNELFKFPLKWWNICMEQGDDLDNFLDAIDSTLKAEYAFLDTLCLQHPTLSARFSQFSKDNMAAQAASELGQARFCTPTRRLSPRARQYAYEHFWKKMSKPYPLHRDWRMFFRDYANDMIEESSAGTYSFDVWDFVEDIASDAEELDFLKNCKSWMEEANARLASVENEEEKKRLLEQNEKENEERLKRANALFNSPKAKEVIGKKIFLEDMRLKIHVLDSIGTDSFIKTVLLCEDAYKRLDYTRKPLSQEIMDSLVLWTGNSPALQGIREKNEFYTALANRKLDQLVLKTGSEVEGLQEGQEILSKLTEPYRGKFILLDIWGTWCGPCKDALSHSQEEYQRLAKYDIQYMYLANNSPKDTWENVIKEYNVTGSNVVHFNLPPEQQQAIERYLKVASFPTYKVIDPEGRVLDVTVDPRNLDSTEKLFQMLTEK